MTMLTRWHRRHDEGGALVELAVALPILVVILAGTVDFARVFYLSMSLTNAARAGAQYGGYSVEHSIETGSVGMKAAAATTNVPGGLATSDVAAGCTAVCANPGGTTFTAPTPNTCSGTCTSSDHLVMTVTVTATKTFSTLMGVLPGIPSPMTITRAATMRVAN